MKFCMRLAVTLMALGSVACQTTEEIFKFLNGINNPMEPFEYTNSVTTTTPRTPSRIGTTGAVVCTMDNGVQGYCVPQKACAYGKIVTNGSGAIKPRISNTCPVLSQVCCALSPSSTVTTTTTTFRPGVITPSSATHTTAVPKGNAKLCGVIGRTGLSRAANWGGIQLANFLEYPWTVPIFEGQGQDEEFLAGGSLIHPRVVLTTAAQFNSYEVFVVKAGDWDIKTDDELIKKQESVVKEVIIHPKFNSGSMSHNIALLVLATAINPNEDNIGFACLPNTATAVGTACFGTGWGPNNMGDALPDKPKKVRLPIFDKMDCQTVLRKVSNPNMVLDNSVICAGGEAGMDTCKYDGGSPLMCPYPKTKKRVYAAGIVSWGRGCGVAGRPAVYTDVAALRRWIDDQFKARGLETSYYTA